MDWTLGCQDRSAQSSPNRAREHSFPPTAACPGWEVAQEVTEHPKRHYRGSWSEPEAVGSAWVREVTEFSIENIPKAHKPHSPELKVEFSGQKDEI